MNKFKTRLTRISLAPVALDFSFILHPSAFLLSFELVPFQHLWRLLAAGPAAGRAFMPLVSGAGLHRGLHGFVFRGSEEDAERGGF